jgi:thymidylate synthase (FAD)
MFKVTRKHYYAELGVANAARVSFAKEKQIFDKSDEKLLQYLRTHKHWTPFAHSQVFVNLKKHQFTLPDNSTFDGDIVPFIRERYMELNSSGTNEGFEYANGIVRISYTSEMFIGYILEKLNLTANDFFKTQEEHKSIIDDSTKFITDKITLGEISEAWKVSRLPYIQFHITCPMFVFNQLTKHRRGVVINSESRRYIDREPAFWEPRAWRKQSDSNKQGSVPGSTIDEVKVNISDDNISTLGYNDICNLVSKWYSVNTENGMCKEHARAILPMSMETSFIITLSIQDLARMIMLRVAPDAQEETADVVRQMRDIAILEFPYLDKLVEIGREMF